MPKAGEVITAGAMELEAGDYSTNIYKGLGSVPNWWVLFTLDLEYIELYARYPMSRFTLHRNYRLKTALSQDVLCLAAEPSPDGECVLDTPLMPVGFQFGPIPWIGACQVLDVNEKPMDRPVITPATIRIPTYEGSSFKLRFRGRI